MRGEVDALAHRELAQTNWNRRIPAGGCRRPSVLGERLKRVEMRTIGGVGSAARLSCSYADNFSVFISSYPSRWRFLLRGLQIRPARFRSRPLARGLLWIQVCRPGKTRFAEQRQNVPRVRSLKEPTSSAPMLFGLNKLPGFAQFASRDRSAAHETSAVVVDRGASGAPKSRYWRSRFRSKTNLPRRRGPRDIPENGAQAVFREHVIRAVDVRDRRRE